MCRARIKLSVYIIVVCCTKKEKNYGKKLKKIQKICLQRGLYAGNASPRQRCRKSSNALFRQDIVSINKNAIKARYEPRSALRVYLR